MKAAALRPLAETDLIERSLYYRQAGGSALAERFFDAAIASIASIEANPGLGSPRVGELIGLDGLRRIGIEGFPCGGLYLERPKHLDVIRLLADRQDRLGARPARRRHLIGRPKRRRNGPVRPTRRPTLPYRAVRERTARGRPCRHHGRMDTSRVRNLDVVLSSITEHWSPRTIATVNDYDVRVVKVEGEFTRHSHPETDEFFLVLSGCLTIRMDGGDVVLSAGDTYVVPRGRPHQPCADAEATLLLFEPSETVNTGDTPSRLTAARRLA